MHLDSTFYTIKSQLPTQRFKREAIVELRRFNLTPTESKIQFPVIPVKKIADKGTRKRPLKCSWQWELTVLGTKVTNVMPMDVRMPARIFY